MKNGELAALAKAVAEARLLLESHGDVHTATRLRELERGLAAGDESAVVSAVAEATGSMGSLNDRYLCIENGDAIEAGDVVPVNARLRRLVGQVERRARAAAAAHGIALVR